MYGRQHADAIARELNAIEREHPGPYLAAYVERGHSELARLQGRFSNARRLTQRAMEAFQALGMPEMAALCELDLARTELTAQTPAAALAALLRGDAILARLGERSLRSEIQALLALAHAQLRHRDAARAAIELAQELGTDEDALTNAMTHRVRASFALADGDRADAERWSRSAVAHAMLSDNVVVQARARLDLARILCSLGQRENATTEARAARQLFIAKGDHPGDSQTQALLDELAEPATVITARRIMRHPHRTTNAPTAWRRFP
jgi:ATP/maltotriose-dependent transcriptional regulator MalT